VLRIGCLVLLIATLAGCGDGKKYSQGELDQAVDDAVAQTKKNAAREREKHGDRRYDNGFADGYDEGTIQTLGGSEYPTGVPFIVSFQNNGDLGQSIATSIEMELGIPVICDSADDCYVLD
jgi:hypothetical protein